MDFSFNTGKSLLRNVHSNSVMSIIDCWIVPSRIDSRILGRELLVELSYVDSYAIYGFKTTILTLGWVLIGTFWEFQSALTREDN